MEISRQNYEQYFVDYLDGKLNEKQVGILLSFLEFNPDLEEEFADIEKMCIAPDEIKFSGKAKLIKSESDLAEENILKDFDMYCISSMEHDIADEDEVMLQDILGDDPDKEHTYMLYQSTRLLPDESIIYPGKAKLKKRFIGLPYHYFLPAAAAVAALLIIIQVFNNRGPETGNPTLTDQVPENPRVEPGAQALQRQDNASPAESLETAPVQTTFITPKQPIMTEESIPEDGAPSGRENIQLAMVGSRSMERIESVVASPDETGNSSITLRQNTYPDEWAEEVDPSGDNPKVSLWILADAGVRGLNSVSEDEYHLDRKKDNNGRTRRFTFDSPVFGISAPLRKSDKEQ